MLYIAQPQAPQTAPDVSAAHCCLPPGHTWKSRRDVGKSSRFLMSRGAMQLGDSTTGRGFLTTTGRTRL